MPDKRVTELTAIDEVTESDLVLLVEMPAASGTPAFVRNITLSANTQTISTNAIVWTLATACDAGDLLHVVCKRHQTATPSDTIASATDSVGGNTWHVDYAGLTVTGEVIYGVVSSVLTNALGIGATVTVTWNDVARFNYWSAQMTEYSGIATSNWWDRTAAATSFASPGGAGTDLITSGPTAALSETNELCVAAICTANPTDVLTAGAGGWTLRSQFSDTNSGNQNGVEDKVVSVTTAVTATASWDTATARDEGAILVTYKAGGSAGSPVNKKATIDQLRQTARWISVSLGGSRAGSLPLAVGTYDLVNAEPSFLIPALSASNLANARMIADCRSSDPTVNITPQLVNASTLANAGTGTACTASSADYSGTNQHQTVAVTVVSGQTYKAQAIIAGSGATSNACFCTVRLEIG